MWRNLSGCPVGSSFFEIQKKKSSLFVYIAIEEAMKIDDRDYQNPKEIEITTLEEVLYINMKTVPCLCLNTSMLSVSTFHTDVWSMAQVCRSTSSGCVRKKSNRTSGSVQCCVL